MLATLVAVRKDRDAKAELNRRSQVCEVLTGTGNSRRVKKWSAGSAARSRCGEATDERLARTLAPATVGHAAAHRAAVRKMDGHVGSAPCIPVWKTGVYLSTLMLGEMESRAGIAPASAVLQTAA